MKKYVSAFLLTSALCLTTSAQEPAAVQTPVPVAPQQKISAGIIVDNSGSFRLALEYVIRTAQAVTKIVETDDEAFLVRFVGPEKIETLQDLTGDKDSLVSATDELYIEGGRTAITEALMHSAKYLKESGKNERKILILITDGDNKSDKKFHADAIKYLKDNNISVFAIGITFVLDENRRDAQKFLEKLTSETGGALINVEKRTGNLEAADALIKAIRANNNGK
jgi:Ca-activated chloride channel homolog